MRTFLLYHYALIKTVHIGCAVLSITLFITRALWYIRDSKWRHSVWARKVPHYIDTLFLGSALLLAYSIQQYPFAAPWVTLKVILLLVYIGLGFATVRLENPRAQTLSLVLAVMVFAYIVSVALSKQLLPWRAWLG